MGGLFFVSFNPLHDFDSSEWVVSSLAPTSSSLLSSTSSASQDNWTSTFDPNLDYRFSFLISNSPTILLLSRATLHHRSWLWRRTFIAFLRFWAMCHHLAIRQQLTTQFRTRSISRSRNIIYLICGLPIQCHQVTCRTPAPLRWAVSLRL